MEAKKSGYAFLFWVYALAGHNSRQALPRRTSFGQGFCTPCACQSLCATCVVALLFLSPCNLKALHAPRK